MIQKRFDPLLSNKDDLPPQVHQCIAKFTRCLDFYINIVSTHNQRVGNSFLDIFNFKRITHTKSWKFQAFFIVIDDKVVFKLWNGSPRLRNYKNQVNSLGPLKNGIRVGVNYDLNNS